MSPGDRHTAEILVIGAGALGLAVSYHLAKRGVRVCVLEREASFGMHASSKNAGMFRQLYRHPQLTDWAQRSLATWPQAARDLAFRPTGSLIVDRHVPVHHPGLFVQRTLADQTPAVYTPSDGLLTPYDLLHGIYQLTPKSHARYHFGQEVVALSHNGSMWQAETRSGQLFRAERVLNAAGAWLNRFFVPELAERCAVKAQPYARHLFVLQGWDPGFMPTSDVGYYWDERHAWYMRRWDLDGERLVSICDQTPATPERFVPPADLHERLARRLLSALPDQAPALSVGPSWFCFRTYTDDQRPIFGEDPEFPGLFWLAAFGGFGMSTSFAAAADAAAWLCGDPLSLPPDFSPSRVRG